MLERSFTVRNKAGIHCRPSGVILNAIKNEFPDHFFEVVTSSSRLEINSMLALLTLELTCGTTALLRVEGVDEERALQRIGDLLEYEFDFPPRK
jgi:phosphocarrier protein